jgi:hypothetical protein
VFGFCALTLGAIWWASSVLAAVLSGGADLQELAGYVLILPLAASFIMMGRLADQFGLLMAGKAPPLSGRLFLKKLLGDLAFEITGILFLPLAVSGLSLTLCGRAFGWGVLLLAFAVAIGLPRALRAAVRKM